MERNRFLAPVIAAGILAMVSAEQSALADGGRFDDRIAGVRQTMNDMENAYTDFEFASQSLKELDAEDVIAAKKWFDALAAKFQIALDLFKQEKETQAQAAFQQALDMSSGRGVWGMRLLYRQRQHDAAPTEEWMTAQRGWTPPGVEPWLTKLIEAHKACSEAWGRAADALVPDGDPVAAAKVLNEAFDLSTNVNIADVEINWARQMNDLNHHRTITPAVEQKIAAVEEAQQHIAQSMRDRTHLEQQLRELDLKQTELNHKRDEVFNAANQELVKALEAAAKAKQ